MQVTRNSEQWVTIVEDQFDSELRATHPSGHREAANVHFKRGHSDHYQRASFDPRLVLPRAAGTLLLAMRPLIRLMASYPTQRFSIQPRYRSGWVVVRPSTQADNCKIPIPGALSSVDGIWLVQYTAHACTEVVSRSHSCLVFVIHILEFLSATATASQCDSITAVLTLMRPVWHPTAPPPNWPGPRATAASCQSEARSTARPPPSTGNVG